MKRNLKAMLGVTLLEIMLVLAIAALIIIMSIRFYGSASTSNKVNAAQTAVQGVVAAVESYLSAGGSLENVVTGVLPYLPGGKMPTSPFDGKVVTLAAGSSTAGTYEISIDVPGEAASGSVAIVGSPCSQFQIALEKSGTMTVDCGGLTAKVTVSIYGTTS